MNSTREIIDDSAVVLYCTSFIILFDCFCIFTGELMKVRIWHDNKFFGANWFLESVEITDESAGESFMFPCNRWLAKDKDDGSLVRELTCSNPKKSTGSRMPSGRSRDEVM